MSKESDKEFKVLQQAIQREKIRLTNLKKASIITKFRVDGAEFKDKNKDFIVVDSKIEMEHPVIKQKNKWVVPTITKL